LVDFAVGNQPGQLLITFKMGKSSLDFSRQVRLLEGHDKPWVPYIYLSRAKLDPAIVTSSGTSSFFTSWIALFLFWTKIAVLINSSCSNLMFSCLSTYCSSPDVLG
jgi:hypothetical protein